MYHLELLLSVCVKHESYVHVFHMFFAHMLFICITHIVHMLKKNTCISQMN